MDETATTTDLMQQLADSVRTLVSSNDRLRSELADQLGIGPSELNVLGHLHEAVELTPTYLARAVGLTTGTLTSLLDRLERAGYVERFPHPKDRRSIVIRSTPAAEALMTQNYGLYNEALANALANQPLANPVEVIAFLNAATEMLTIERFTAAPAPVGS